jgi:flagellar biosynthesis protein FliR
LIPVGLVMLLLTMSIWFEQVENLWFVGFSRMNQVIGGS